MAADAGFMPKKLATQIQPGGGSLHAVELQGDSLLYSVGSGPDKTTARITPTREQWRAFRRALDDQHVWRWRPKYRRNITDSTSWSLHIEYADRSLIAEGDAAFPQQSDDAALPRYPFRRYQLAVQELLGGRPFAQQVKPLDLFALEELRLVETHPARNQRDQWADFRDPDGKIHRVRRGEHVGGHDGVLVKVGAASVSVKELVQDVGGEWIERERVMRKPAPR